MLYTKDYFDWINIVRMQNPLGEQGIHISNNITKSVFMRNEFSWHYIGKQAEQMP